MRSRRAFTLIELLVVIAIIAILAAILFPVFAQAKVAAKGAASISNDKQITTASMIYMTDYDDNPVLEAQGDADAPILLLGNPYKPWGYLLRPYTKNGDIFQDPLTTKELGLVGVPNDVLYMYRTQYGYAFTIHSPVTYTAAGFNAAPVTSTLLAKPAETVMFILKKARNNNPDWLWVGSLVWGANLVNPPVLSISQFETGAGINPYSVCSPIMCWGTNCTAYPGQSEEEGGLSGGNAFRKVKKSIVALSDGHVRPYAIGQLAAGTNWTRTTPGWTVQLTDRNQYLWDMD